MRVAALFSGGKDSTYALYVAQQSGWRVTHLVSLLPADPDSMMFHVPNLHLLPLHSDALDIPLVQREAGVGEASELAALEDALRGLPVDGVVTGAIASDYQWSRIHGVGHALGLRVFAPLWRKEPEHLLRDIVAAGFDVRIAGVSAEGLGRDWLGRPLDEGCVQDLLRLNDLYGVHPSGEGGEFESLVLDGPNFRKRLVVDESEVEWRGSGGQWRVRRAHLETT